MTVLQVRPLPGSRGCAPCCGDSLRDTGSPPLPRPHPLGLGYSAFSSRARACSLPGPVITSGMCDPSPPSPHDSLFPPCTEEGTGRSHTCPSRTLPGQAAARGLPSWDLLGGPLDSAFSTGSFGGSPSTFWAIIITYFLNNRIFFNIVTTGKITG